MSLRHASHQVADRGSCLRSSYAGISWFIRTRYHGIAPLTATGLGHTVRCFSSSETRRISVELDEKLRRSLNDFKDTIHPSIWKEMRRLGRELNTEQPGKEVTLCGYLETRRDVTKNLSFAVLRNQNQTVRIQLVSIGNASPEEREAHVRLRCLRDWTPVVVKGTVKERQSPPEANKELEDVSPAETEAHDETPVIVEGTGKERRPQPKDKKESEDVSPSDHRLSVPTLINHREIALKSIIPLNEIPSDIIIKEETVFGPEHRHLQLRTNGDVRTNILMRHHAMREARLILNKNLWKEIETPILFKSTPEGAREFLVPTRNKGLAYALPQSPQQYKQILMASGFTKYYQFARCFRDEDLRADRQPEFTQLDMEMSFAGEEEIMEEIERIIKHLWYNMLRVKMPTQLPRMTYQEAMALYGSDKPDLRFIPKIHQITQCLSSDLISKITPLQDPAVDALKIPVSHDPKVTRKFISSFLDSPDGKPYLNNPHGQPAVFVGDASQPLQGLGALGHAFAMDSPQELIVDHGELLILQARKNEPFSGGSTVLGNLRLALHKAAIAQGLIPAPAPNLFKFLWVTDFPLFSPSTDAEPGQGGTAGLSSTHHPFTAPKTPADVDLLLTSPASVTAAHYDLVVNGVELGGGSRRIHNAAVQEFIFRNVLKMPEERIEDFRHLLDVLRSGCPPHAGIALGWDRLMAVVMKTESVRDVIAFPKSGSGEDVLVKAPNRITEEQLETYHLSLKE